MPKRRCATTGCPNLVPAGTRRCPTHARAHDKARGTRQQRGYGRDHDRLRQHWQTLINNGRTPTCPKCGHPIIPTDPWDLGHTPDRTTWTGPEHARCNRTDGGRRAHRYQ